MEKGTFIRAGELQRELDISAACAYKIIRELNQELEDKGYVTVRGLLSRKYFEERVYGYEWKEVC